MSLSASLKSRQLVQARGSVRTISCRRFAGVVARAGPDDGLNFKSNAQAAEGYVEKDSAGQTNMYPSVTRPFEAGSKADTVNSNTLLIGAAAAAVAAAAIFAGLTSVNVGLQAAPSTPSAVTSDGDYQALSAYAAKFSSELGVRKAAPKPAAPAAPAVVVEAPPAPVADVAAPQADVAQLVAAPAVEAEVAQVIAAPAVEVAAAPAPAAEVATPEVAVTEVAAAEAAAPEVATTQVATAEVPAAIEETPVA